MLLKIIRNLTPEEVEVRLKRFEKEFGMSFEKFEELFLKQRLDAKLVRAFFEWSELMDSYKGYAEEGTLDYVVEEFRDLKPHESVLLTPKRIELLYKLAALRVESINDLAQKVRRDVKNVYQDLKVLSKLGFVKLNRQKGRTIIPETLVKEIAFLIR
ncbi:MAG: HVO_A0114 family putative DNA-binding protein [Candidatus Bathycorpusculaceae bacterium]